MNEATMKVLRQAAVMVKALNDNKGLTDEDKAFIRGKMKGYMNAAKLIDDSIRKVEWDDDGIYVDGKLVAPV